MSEYHPSETVKSLGKKPTDEDYKHGSTNDINLVPPPPRFSMNKKRKWNGIDAKGTKWTNERLIHQLDSQGEIWLERFDGSSHGIFEKDAVPRTCPECGFPILQKISIIYSWREYSLGCPWCDAWLSLCLVCGKLSYTLPDSCNDHEERIALRGIPE